MDVTFLRRSARRTPSKYRKASSIAEVHEEGVEEQASEEEEELQGNANADAEALAVVPVTRAPTPLQVIPPDEEMPMYELSQGPL